MTRPAFARALWLTALTVRAFLGLAAFDAARTLGFARLCAWLRSTCPSTRVSLLPADDIVWAVDEACVWYPKRAACLQRSVVATWLLRGQGLRAEMVIGCRPLPFESHAWVEIEGRVVNDRQAYRAAFVVLDRL